ncbi:hypothetical protein Q604_UNBC01986G0001, partial [human gut metagenome]
TIGIGNPHYKIAIHSITPKYKDIYGDNHHTSTQKENRVAFLLRGFYTYDRLLCNPSVGRHII